MTSWAGERIARGICGIWPRAKLPVAFSFDGSGWIRNRRRTSFWDTRTQDFTISLWGTIRQSQWA